VDLKLEIMWYLCHISTCKPGPFLQTLVFGFQEMCVFEIGKVSYFIYEKYIVFLTFLTVRKVRNTIYFS